MQVKGLLIFLLGFMLMLPLSAIAGKRSGFYADCDSDVYTCMRVRSGQSWESLFPDDREREIIMRINHRNSQLWSGLTLKVPNNLAFSDLLDYSPFPRQIEAPREKLIVFDPKRYAWAAYDAEGSLVRWGPATGGKSWCADIDEACHTKEGRFRIFSMGDSSCVSSKFPIPDGGAPMPYCMYFNGGQALHGSPGGVMRGNESHGCVRMFVSDAEWLRYEFIDPPDDNNDYRGTEVIVLPYNI
jgi:hypothetical protein